MPERPAEGPAIEVRPASADDALVIGDVYLRAWRAGYAGLVDPDQLEPVAWERAAYDWQVAIDDPHASFALGLVDETPAGVAKIGPDPTEAVQGTWLELLYVAPEFWGTGIATELLRWATERAADGGAAVMRLRVVETQGRARRFYEREGWDDDPEVPPSHNRFFALRCMRRSLTIRDPA
jgi:GNAT superfamily N-acetyltransferase